MTLYKDSFRHFLTLALLFVSTVVSANITYWDMESGTFDSYGWKSSGNKGAFSAAGEPACSGERSVKYDLQFYKSPTKYRTEFTSKDGYGPDELAYFTEYWIGFNVFVPEDWKYDSNGEIIFQIQQHPDEGETYRNPPLVFRIDGDHWGASWAANHNKINQMKEYTVHDEAKLSKIKKGTWNSIVLNFKTSFNSDGFYRAYVNGNLELNYHGPIFFNDDAGPYVKFGLYKPSWKPAAIEKGWGGINNGISRRTYFQDDLKIYRGSNGLNSVSTACDVSIPPETDSPSQDDSLSTSPAAAECRKPTFNSRTEPGLFLWKDCELDKWHVRLSGGGNSTGLIAAGTVTSTNGFSSLSEFSYEASDILDNLSQSDEIVYEMTAWNNGVDGFDFTPSSSDSCFVANDNMPIYLGENKQVVSAPLNLDTLESCSIAPKSTSECGKPNYDTETEQGLFLWKDCQLNKWHARLSAGGDSYGVSSSGSVTSTSGFSELSEYKYEASDLLDNSTNIDEIVFKMNVWNRAEDGFDFTPISPDSCFNLDDDVPVYLGAEKHLVTSPLNLDTLASCEIAPRETYECGEPTYDTSNEQGLFLWKNCVDDEWHVRLSGGGASYGVFASGRVISTSGFSSLSEVEYEADDILDNTISSQEIQYKMTVWKQYQDGFDFKLNGSDNCFVLNESTPIYLGESKRTITSPLNLDNLGSCKDHHFYTTNPVEPYECGEPNFDINSDQGLYLWKDCELDEWHVRLSAGSSSDSLVATGKVTSTDRFSKIAEVDYESTDTLVYTTNMDEISYKMNVWKGYLDGFDFSHAGSDSCFTLDENVPIYLGERKRQITAPINLNTLRSCALVSDTPDDCTTSGNGCDSNDPDSPANGSGNSGGDTSGGSTPTSPDTKPGDGSDTGGDNNSGVDGDNSITLAISWTAPSARTDGSVLDLSEIAGYQIFVGDSKSTLEMVMDLNSSATTSAQLTVTPSSNKLFIAITAYDTDGKNSLFSEIFELDIPN